MRKKKIVLVFGVFDGLHTGHRFFLREAKKRGDRLVVAVAPDAAVKRMKGMAPREPLPRRLAALRASGLADEAVPGDDTNGMWSAIIRFAPDVIALGYDQEELNKALEKLSKKNKLSVTLARLPACQPAKYHSSLLK